MSFESFKAGFAKQCVDAGIDPLVALDAALGEKQAFGEGIVGAAGNFLGSAAGTLGGMALPVYVGGSALAGAGIGAAASGMQETAEDDVEDIRKREMIDSYRQLAREMEIRAKNRPQPQFKARSPIMR